MPRPRPLLRPIAWKLSIPADLAATVEESLFDLSRQKPRYGGRSELVCKLLREWLDSLQPHTSFTVQGDIFDDPN